MRPLFKLLPIFVLTGLLGCADATEGPQGPNDVPSTSLEGGKADSPKCAKGACIDEGLQLGDLEMPPSLDALARALEGAGDGTTTPSFEGWTVSDGATIEEVVAVVAENLGPVDNIHIGESMAQPEYRTLDYLPNHMLDAVEAEHGTDYLGIQIRAMSENGNGGETWVSVDLVHFEELDIAYAFTIVANE